MRIIEIMADPLSALLTNKQIAEHCNLSERYIYKLLKNKYFVDEIDKRRKSDKSVKKLIARVWKALFYKIEESPAKIRTAMEALGEIKTGPLVSFVNKYENMKPGEVDERLEECLENRKKAKEYPPIRENEFNN